MDPRARYPPGMGNGRGGNPNYYGRGGNPNYYGRGGPAPPQQYNHQHQQTSAAHHQQQYAQRQPQHHNHHHQQQQQQQWLRRNQIARDAASAAGTSEPKTLAPSTAANGVDSSSQDWKAQLKLPPQDTRYMTEVAGQLLQAKTDAEALAATDVEQGGRASDQRGDQRRVSEVVPPQMSKILRPPSFAVLHCMPSTSLLGCWQPRTAGSELFLLCACFMTAAAAVVRDCLEG